MSIKNGTLIAIEGIDGSGKSTLANNLYKALSKKFEVVLTKEPGGSSIGKELRNIVQNKKLNPIAEFLLFAAERAQHFNDVIIPELNKNKIVISDRLNFSSAAYQGYGKKVNLKKIEEVNSWAMQGIKPDLIIYVKISPEITKQRILDRGLKLTKFEKEKTEFMQTVSNGFDDIFKNKENVLTLDGQLNQEELLKQCLNYLNKNRYNSKL